jgi:NADH dehydrogenase
MSQQRPKVVIVGAGFGGLEAAKALSRVAVDVIVIDRQNHHCFQPLLYQVATAALSPAEIAWPIRHILRQQRNATVLMAEVSGIDLAGRCVQTGAGPISYDYLVVATGATHSYFGHDDWIDFAPGLKRIEDATRIRRSFRRIDPRSSRIILLEAGPRLLPTLPEDLSRYAERTLTRMGVDVRTSTRVTNCDRRGVDLDRGRIDAGAVIWAAGVVASPAARWLGAEHDRAGRVLVRPDLSLPNHPEVFVIGDAAGVHDQTGAMVPGVAPAAKQMGRYVGRVIAARVDDTPSPPPFRYRSFGDLATIGRRAAVVNFGYLRLKGFVGWLFWSLVHIYFLIGVKNRFIVAFTWLWDYLTFHRGARLITEVPPPGRG